MSYNDGRIRVRRYAGERNLRACILQRHKGPTPSVMVWGVIGYHMRSRLLRIEGNLNSNRYIREVLQPEALPLLQATPHAIFQQDNVRPHVARILQAFSQRRQVSLLPWPARSPDMSPIEHVWDMVGRRLIRQGPPAATLDDLWTRIQTVWRDIPQEAIQDLFDSMPRRIETLIAAHILKFHAHRPCTAL
ncbi:Transposable element Tc1 transposase [Blattella germanica]|nr:Transposable element Tc1 transposase [Blattella germanica]